MVTMVKRNYISSVDIESVSIAVCYAVVSVSLSDSDRDCAICMDRSRDSLLCPCHHMITCMECAKSLHNRHDGCPICRKEITEIIRIYHS